MNAFSGMQLHSLATKEGTMRVMLLPVLTSEPELGEVVVRVEASPLNPSDIGLLFGPADVATFRGEDGPNGPELVADIPRAKLASLSRRLGEPLPVGNEGCGTIVATDADSANLLGRRVAMWGGGMYTQYRRLPLSNCLLLPEGTAAADGAGLFINPLTALGFLETARLQGHRAIVHTAAASNLGQMLVRLCQKDGVGLVNIVRREDQAELLSRMGASHVLISGTRDFQRRLREAIIDTGATLAFDALGGGSQANIILSAMEAMACRHSPGFSRYGSDTHKQIYFYGGLDPSPTTLTRSYGMSWSAGGWLLFNFLKQVGPNVEATLHARVLEGMHTVFQSHYGETVNLVGMTDPEVARAYQRKATGSKYLVIPTGFRGASA